MRVHSKCRFEGCWWVLRIGRALGAPQWRHHTSNPHLKVYKTLNWDGGKVSLSHTRMHAGSQTLGPLSLSEYKLYVTRPIDLSLHINPLCPAPWHSISMSYLCLSPPWVSTSPPVPKLWFRDPHGSVEGFQWVHDWFPNCGWGTPFGPSRLSRGSMTGSQTIVQGPPRVRRGFPVGPWLVPKLRFGDPIWSLKAFQRVHDWFPNYSSGTPSGPSRVSNGSMTGSQTKVRGPQVAPGRFPGGPWLVSKL